MDPLADDKQPNPAQDKIVSSSMHEDLAAERTPSASALYTQREPYCQQGFKGLFASQYVALCAAFSAMGGLLFGYDQGVVSVILVEDQFLQRFTRIAEGSGGAGFWKGLLTAMVSLMRFCFMGENLMC